VCQVLDPRATYADGDCKGAYERYGAGPGVLDWVLMRECFTKLEPDYMGLWGARFDPLLYAERNRWWTLVSSAFVHIDIYHLAINCFAFAAIGGFLERRYGSVRLAAPVFLSIVGGNLLSTLFESNCTFYSGLSGAVYGMVALLIADLVVNWDSIRRPVVRIIVFVGAVTMMSIELVSDDSVSSYSHLGGLITGLVPASLFLTRVHWRPRWKTWVLLVCGVTSLLLIFVFLPLALYSEIGDGVAPNRTMTCYGVDFPRVRHGYPVVPSKCVVPDSASGVQPTTTP